MSIRLGKYRSYYLLQRAKFRKALAKDSANPEDLFRQKKELEVMDASVRNAEVSTYRLLDGAEGDYPGAGVFRWHRNIRAEVYKLYWASQMDPDAYVRKMEEYARYWRRIANNHLRIIAFTDPGDGYRYVHRPNKLTIAVIASIEQELQHWFQLNYDYDRLARSIGPAHGLWSLLEERRDLKVALRLAQTLPADVEKYHVGIDRPAWVEVTSFAVGFIPFIGNAIAAYEAYEGRDIFGYKLTDTERAIIGASVLLPFAGRFVKSGKTLYTANRMKKLYGRDASNWVIAQSRGEALSSLPDLMRKLDDTESLIKSGRKVGQELAQELDPLFKKIANDVPLQSSIPGNVDTLTQGLFLKLRSKYSFLDDLDLLSLQRMVDKGPHAHHIKGQLLEELLENRVTKFMANPMGRELLGLPTEIKGFKALNQKLEFFPGHLIRDADGRQITDGVIGFKDKDGVLNLLAVFEAKAGKAASRGLTSKSTSMAKMSKADRHELRMVAREYRLELQEAAVKQGNPFNLTLEQVERKIVKSERGGQIRTDVERLSEGANNVPVDILINGNTQAVRMSTGRTKFFGVLPSNVDGKNIEKTIKDLGYNFEAMPLEITAQRLTVFAKRLAKEISDASTP
jgi:hypothetical protein